MAPAAKPTPSRRLDDTVDAACPKHIPQGFCPKGALVEGSGLNLTHETHDLLRSRLRAAATLQLLGFLAFLVWCGWVGAAGKLHPWIFPMLVGVSAALAAMLAVLYRICPKSLKMLRFCELMVFATPAVFFMVLQYLKIQTCAAQGYFGAAGAPWLLLMFNYSILIPNRWPRAAVVLGTMFLAPTALTLFMIAGFPAVAAVASPEYVTAMGLELLVGVLTGAYGAHIIGALRREAFEARQLGQYKLTKLLGQGGMGEVYLAEHQLLKRPCAIKIIRPEKAGDPQALARFEREVHASAHLSHWNTVEIFDYGRTDDGTFYYVMEYLPGLSLEDLVDNYGPMPASRVLYLMRQVCDGLREAHDQGLIHRDIKPGNIIAAERGGLHDVAKLVDFGLVKTIDEGLSQKLTLEGHITGSPLFLSPEQAAGDAQPDERSDIYSLGAVMYFLLTGRPPFERARTIQVLIAHAHEDVTPPSRHRSDVPEDLERVVMRCLSKQPDGRFSDVESLDRALASCGSDGQWTRHDADRWWKDLNHEPALAG